MGLEAYCDLASATHVESTPLQLVIHGEWPFRAGSAVQIDAIVPSMAAVSF